jgi:hypothetical protein
VLAALLEVTLAEPPSGTKTPDDIEWATLLGLADLYVQATIRSDGLRWNIDGEAAAITDHYEVTRTTGDTPLLDLAAFNAARMRATRTESGDPLVRAPVPIVPDAEELNVMEQPGDVPAQGQLADVDPALVDVDAAMRHDLGCSAHTLLAVCIHVSRWLVTDAHPAATVEREKTHQ